ncbi:MAG TPA: signal peptidase I [Bacillota bacterium]
MEFKKSELQDLIESIAGSVIIILFIMVFLGQSFMVKGSSMEPTFYEGQRLLVDKITYRVRTPQAGEIVVFKYPRDPRKKFIKRVIATAGDYVYINDSKVQVNGITLHEPYINEPTEDGIEWTRVPEDTLFVLGDNRNHSMDSRDTRNVGCIPIENIVGKAFVVYWPPKAIKVLKKPDYNKVYEFEGYGKYSVAVDE